MVFVFWKFGQLIAVASLKNNIKLLEKKSKLHQFSKMKVL